MLTTPPPPRFVSGKFDFASLLSVQEKWTTPTAWRARNLKPHLVVKSGLFSDKENMLYIIGMHNHAQILWFFSCHPAKYARLPVQQVKIHEKQYSSYVHAPLFST